MTAVAAPYQLPPEVVATQHLYQVGRGFMASPAVQVVRTFALSLAASLLRKGPAASTTGACGAR